MKNIYLLLFLNLLLLSCSNKRQLVYLQDSEKSSLKKINNFQNNNVEFGDILKIDVQSSVPEAATPYNKIQNLESTTPEMLKISGYLVDESYFIKFPVLGMINVNDLNLKQIESRIEDYLVEGGHLINPIVTVKRINSKFTILGQVTNPGTFSFYDNTLNIFQALGYAGDLTIEGKREEITLIREENGLRKVYSISLNKSDILNKPYYYIKNNDVLIIKPNFSKVKSAGFIGSPESISAIASLILSITLLIINK